MARNVEVKARLSDPRRLRARLAALGAVGPRLLVQKDTFFRVPAGRLKLREEGGGEDEGRRDGGSRERSELIAYARPDGPEARTSSYALCDCAEPALLSALLGASLGVRGVVEKRRELFRVGRTRVHLDEVRGLGAFLELEVVLGPEEPVAAGEREAGELLRALEVPREDHVAGAYIDLLEAGTGPGSPAAPAP